MISRDNLTKKYPISPLGDAVEFLDHLRKPVKEADRRKGLYPYYGANGLQGSIDDYIFDENLILLAEDGGHFDNPNRGIAYAISGKSWVNNHAHVLRPKGIDLNYLLHVLKNYNVRPWITGTTRGKLTKSGASEILIPVPLLPEQRRIAAILDKAKALRSMRSEAIAKLDQLLQSVFLEMFGDPVSNPKNWPIGNLTHLGSLDRGISKHRPRGALELLGGVHPLIQTGDVSRAGAYIRSYKSTYSDLGLAQSKKWPKGTLCITIAANIAETAILDFEACFPDSVVGFTSKKSGSVEYVYMLLTFLKKILDEKAPQVAQKNINLEILRNLPIPIPLQKDQIKWAAFLLEIEKQKSQLLNSQDTFENLTMSLQAQFFTQ